MLASDAKLFVFTAQAVAGENLSHRPGARHALLVYATAPDAERAARTAVERVTAEGWLHVDLLRSKVISTETGLISDDTIRAAAESALSDGCAFIIYGIPMQPDA